MITEVLNSERCTITSLYYGICFWGETGGACMKCIKTIFFRVAHFKVMIESNVFMQLTYCFAVNQVTCQSENGQHFFTKWKQKLTRGSQ